MHPADYLTHSAWSLSARCGPGFSAGWPAGRRGLWLANPEVCTGCARRQGVAMQQRPAVNQVGSVPSILGFNPIDPCRATGLESRYIDPMSLKPASNENGETSLRACIFEAMGMMEP